MTPSDARHWRYGGGHVVNSIRHLGRRFYHRVYVYLVEGHADLDGFELATGDAAKVLDQPDLTIAARAPGELIMVDCLDRVRAGRSLEELSVVAQSIDSNQRFSPMPLESWAPSKETLHRYLQIVGKIRLAVAPPRNHWWPGRTDVQCRRRQHPHYSPLPLPDELPGLARCPALGEVHLRLRCPDRRPAQQKGC